MASTAMPYRPRASLREITVCLLTFLPLASGTTQTLDISTPGQYSYTPLVPPAGFNISILTRLNFSVQICNDAHLLLSQDPAGAQPLYEIVIGGWSNSKSVIRDRTQGSALATERHNTPPLACAAFRAFFASWEDGVVRVGSVEGEGDQQVESVFIVYSDPTPFPVHFAFVSGWNRAGTWRFDFTDFSAGTTSTAPSSTADDQTSPLSTFTSDLTSAEMTSPQTILPEMATYQITTISSDIVPLETSSYDVSTNEVKELQTTSTNYDVTEEDTTSDDVPTTETTATTSIGNPNPTNQPIPVHHHYCPCHCASLNATEPEAIVSQLRISASSTSAARRRRTSAPDDRPSSMAIGAVGVVCLLCPVVLIVCLDLLSVMTHMDRAVCG